MRTWIGWGFSTCTLAGEPNLNTGNIPKQILHAEKSIVPCGIFRMSFHKHNGCWIGHLEDIIQHQALGLQKEPQGKLQPLLRKNVMTCYHVTCYLMVHSTFQILFFVFFQYQESRYLEYIRNEYISDDNIFSIVNQSLIQYWFNIAKGTMQKVSKTESKLVFDTRVVHGWHFLSHFWAIFNHIFLEWTSELDQEWVKKWSFSKIGAPCCFYKNDHFQWHSCFPFWWQNSLFSISAVTHTHTHNHAMPSKTKKGAASKTQAGSTISLQMSLKAISKKCQVCCYGLHRWRWCTTKQDPLHLLDDIQNWAASWMAWRELFRPSKAFLWLFKGCQEWGTAKMHCKKHQIWILQADSHICLFC